MMMRSRLILDKVRDINQNLRNETKMNHIPVMQENNSACYIVISSSNDVKKKKKNRANKQWRIKILSLMIFYPIFLYLQKFENS